ncbi:MAG: hypothetical protein R6U92_08265 [Bacillota bacterium]
MAPVVVTLLFTAAWGGNAFHFFGRPGIIPDGLFPAAVGLTYYALTQFGPAVRDRLPSPDGIRELVPTRLLPVAALVAIWLISTLFTQVFRAPVRDQLVVLAAMIILYLLMSPDGAADDAMGLSENRGEDGGNEAKPCNCGGQKLARFARTAPLSMISATASVFLFPEIAEAAGHCEEWGFLYELCEAVHHAPSFALGGAAAAVASSTLTERIADSSHAEEVSDPCAEQRRRWEASSARAKMLQNSLQTLRRAHTHVSMEWERNRQEGYWDASWAVATFTAGWATRGATTAVVAGSVLSAMGRKLAENMANSMTEAAFKNLLRGMAEHDMTWEDLITKPADTAANPVPTFLELAKQSLINDVSDNLEEFGFQVGSREYSAALSDAGNNYIGPAFDFVGDMISVYNFGSGIWASADRSKKLLQMRSKLSSAISSLEWDFEQAVFELRLDRESYNDCLEFHDATH